MPDASNNSYLDQDLKDLLADIDEEDTDDPRDVKEETQEPVSSEAAADTEKKEVAPTVIQPQPAQPDPPVTDVNSLIKEFVSCKSIIDRNFEDDRIKIQEYIDMIIKDISDKQIIRSHHLEAIASLMSTKAATGANKIRILDSMTRMIQTIKNLNTRSDNTTFDMSHVQKILDEDDGIAP